MTNGWQHLSIPDAWVRSLDRFEDARGENVVLHDGDLSSTCLAMEFVHDTCSVSYCGVLRGIHTDEEAWRLMTCLVGHVHFAVVDFRVGQAWDRQVEILTLSDKTRLQVLLPPMVGAGFAVMSPLAVMHYKWSLPYDRMRQRTYPYNDPAFQIVWPCVHPLVSERDRVGD